MEELYITPSQDAIKITRTRTVPQYLMRPELYTKWNVFLRDSDLQAKFVSRKEILFVVVRHYGGNRTIVPIFLLKAPTAVYMELTIDRQRQRCGGFV